MSTTLDSYAYPKLAEFTAQVFGGFDLLSRLEAWLEESRAKTIEEAMKPFLAGKGKRLPVKLEAGAKAMIESGFVGMPFEGEDPNFDALLAKDANVALLLDYVNEND